MDIFNGFLRAMVPEQITGVAIRRSELYYMVVWRNHDNTSYCIHARFMNEHVPMMVIEFYQQLIIESVVDEFLDTFRNQN